MLSLHTVLYTDSLLLHMGFNKMAVINISSCEGKSFAYVLLRTDTRRPEKLLFTEGCGTHHELLLCKAPVHQFGCRALSTKPSPRPKSRTRPSSRERFLKGLLEVPPGLLQRLLKTRPLSYFAPFG